MGVISFHSLEDRLTKNFFREKSKPFSHSPGEPIARRGGDPVVVLLTKKGICPGEQEVSRNPPSRSARLRGVEKIKDEGTK
jgi:16S rRNA (cytosine1402-N4)-methyltransferase